MPKFKVAVARFPYGNQEAPSVTNWLLETAIKHARDPRIEETRHFCYDDTPITMTRNKAVKDALAWGADYLLMVDSDMAPDLPGEQPFWDTTWKFMLEHRGPCVVGAPYCGPPPFNNVYVFQWANFANWDEADVNHSMKLEQYTREEAAKLAGMVQVGALPTGLMLIDCRAFSLKKEGAWFYYEWADKEESVKGSTEDVTFTRDLALLGVPQYCNFSSWAGHWKRILVKKPNPITVDEVRAEFRRAIELGITNKEKLVMWGEGKPDPHFAPSQAS